MTEKELIERAIESAKCRIYRVRANVGESLVHQVKADNQAEIMQVTIKALEKQIAKKVTEFNKPYHLDYMCPSCNTATYGQPYAPNYCKHCGQRLLFDWGNEDDRD